ncbi:MAG: alpha/beta hydrolase [Acidobacteriota bacterium]
MKAWIALAVALAVLASTAIAVGAWLFVKRPLALYAWSTRGALARSGLVKIQADTPAGAQTVFTGGRGPATVLLHGAGDQAGTWFLVVPELAKKRSLIVPDLAGHGDSAPEKGPIAFTQVLEGVEGVIRSLAAGRKVTVVGNSLGAWVGIHVALRHPEWIERVVCVNGGPLRGSSGASAVLPRTREEARASVALTRDPASRPIPDKVLDDIVRQARVGPLARFAATASTMEPWVLADEQLGALKVPVDIVWGASDRLMPVEYARRMQAAIPGARLQTLEACGHVPQVECPLALIAALATVLEDAP